MLFWSAVLLLLSQVFTRTWIPTHAYPGEIRRGPDTHITEPGTTVWFTCHTIGIASWVINGTLTAPHAYVDFERKGFHFSRDYFLRPMLEINMTMNINVSLEINDTSIQCQAIGSDINQVARSQTAKLIIGTPPLSPTPEVQLINATALLLSWGPPFTWSEYPLLNYTVRMHNTSSGEQFAWVHMIPATVTTYEVFSSGGMISSSYHELVFSVTASNDLGESTEGTVNSGFPVVPGEFDASHIAYEVSFQQSDRSFLLEITFVSPQVCPSAWYRITVTGSRGDIIINKVDHNLTSGVLVHKQITSNITVNQQYILTLVAETLSGSNTPFTLYFTPPASDRETKDSTMIITAVSLGTSMVLCILVAIVVGAVCFCRRNRGHDKRDPVEKLPKSMIASTNYDGHVYDTIDTKQPKSRAEDPQYDDIPPRLPPARKEPVIKEWVSERETENMAVSFCHELMPPTGDEYTIMKPASVGMMRKSRRKKSATPLDLKNDYIIINL